MGPLTFSGPRGRTWTLLRGVPSFSALLLFFSLFGVEAAAGRTITVDRRSPIATIAAALRLARPHDTLFLSPGMYDESALRVTLPLTIRGADRARVLVCARGQGSIFLVHADSVRFEDLTLSETGISYSDDRAAIKFFNTRHCAVERVTVRNAFFGIYFSHCAKGRVRECRIESNALLESASGNGIHSWYGDSLDIENNFVAHHRDGIYLEFTRETLVRNNTSRDNLRYGLHFMFADDNRYEGNTFQRNGSGVAVMYTRRVHMRGNVFRDNWGGASYGLLLKDITDSEITDNAFDNNTVGLYGEGGARLTVRGNLFRGNGWALRLMANCTDNRFEGNTFTGNSFDVATNSRATSSLFRRNYWDAYRGYDLNHDGIGDVPYRPARMFSYIVEQNPPALILLNSFIIALLDVTERVFPTLSPVALADPEPLMKPPRR